MSLTKTALTGWCLQYFEEGRRPLAAMTNEDSSRRSRGAALMWSAASRSPIVCNWPFKGLLHGFFQKLGGPLCGRPGNKSPAFLGSIL